MKTLTYQPMTPAQWQQLSCVFEDTFSLNIETTSGCNNYRGFSFEWCYNEEIQSLNLQCTKKPVWVPESFIETQINTLVSKILTSDRPINNKQPQGVM